METISHIASFIGFALGVYAVFFKKEKDSPSKTEFIELNELVKEHKEILRNSKP